MFPLRKITIRSKIRIQLKLKKNTHRNDGCRTDGPPCNEHCQIPGHNFNVHAKFTIIEQVCKKSLSKLKIRSLLEHREDFWILKLQTLSPQYIYIYKIVKKCTTAKPIVSSHFIRNILLIVKLVK